MRITFVLPYIKLRGGTQLVLGLADKLVGTGDKVLVVWPTRIRPLPGYLNELEFLWRAPWKHLTANWYSTRATVLAVPSLAERYIPDSDVVVATNWQTANWVASYGVKKGRKVYYIRKPELHENFAGCAATYKLPFDLHLTLSEWSADQLLKHFELPVHAITHEGIDPERIPMRSGSPAPVVTRIGMGYDPSPRKAFEDGYEAFLEVRKEHPGLELHLLGTPRRPPAFPDFVHPHFHIEHDEKIRLFHSTQVWMSSSLEEGWGIVPMEAMATGNAVVTTRVGGTPHFAHDGETALVVDPGDRAGLTSGLRRLVEDTKLRHRLITSGTGAVRELTLERTAHQFRTALMEGLSLAEE